MLKLLFGAACMVASMVVTKASPLVVNVLGSGLQDSQIRLADKSPSAAAAPTSVQRPSPSEIKALQQQLILAPSNQGRQAILVPNPPDASNMTYQFVNNTVKAPTGGTIGLAAVDQFPAFIGTNVAFAVGFVNPCGLNVPHSHPRANEFLVVVQGTLIGSLVLEANPGNTGNLDGNNSVGPIPTINATLSNYKGMLFPRGLTHFQFNPTCEPAVFTAGFDNSDPGRTQIAQNFFSIQPDDVLISATGGDLELLDASRLDQLRGKIPHAFAELIGSCAQRCGIPVA